jgi:uncharacterized protein YerC
MQVSKRKINKQLEQNIKQVFCQVITDINAQEKAAIFLSDFLTETEYIALAKRMAIMLYLDKGLSYEQIKKELKVSSATIATVQSAIEKKAKGYEMALQFIKAEEFANKWTGKISGIFGKK